MLARTAIIAIIVMAVVACGASTPAVTSGPVATAVGSPEPPTTTQAPVVTEAPATPAAATQAARETVTVKGSGTSKSKRFRLAGDYEVTWTATPKNDGGCVHGAFLERADGTFMNEMLGDEDLESKKPLTGMTNLYNLDDADYYVSAISGCAWSYVFAPAQ